MTSPHPLNPSKMRRELDRLTDAGVIAGWRCDDSDSRRLGWYVRRIEEDDGNVRWSTAEARAFIEGVMHVIRDFDVPLAEYRNYRTTPTRG